jgi:hypothetical protein
MQKIQLITFAEAVKLLGYKGRQSIYQNRDAGRLDTVPVMIQTSGHHSHEEVIFNKKFEALLKSRQAKEFDKEFN